MHDFIVFMHFLSLVKTCFLGQFSMKFLCWKLLPSMLLLLMLLCLLLLLLLLFAALSQKQNTHKIYIKVYLLYIQKPRKSSSHVYNFIHLFIHSKFCNMEFQLPLSRHTFFLLSCEIGILFPFSTWERVAIEFEPRTYYKLTFIPIPASSQLIYQWNSIESNFSELAFFPLAIFLSILTLCNCLQSNCCSYCNYTNEHISTDHRI